MNKDTHLIFEAYSFKGLAAGKSLEDIAKKHGVEITAIKNQIEKGAKVEHEHTKNEHIAKKIATDHVFEDPKYYDKLSKIETKNENSEQLAYSYEKIAALLPKDIEEGKTGENKILNLAAPILAKLAYKGDIKKANKYMYYDEDFNSDLVSTYRHFQKHGFPYYDETPGTYAKDMEKDYASQKLGNEDAEMPTHDFNKLKQHINKGPIQIKKPSKELPYTHKYIHPLAKQDSREGQNEENAEDSNTSNWVNIFHRSFGPGYKEEMEKSGLDPYEFFVDYYIAYLKNPEIVNKFAEIYNSKYPAHKVDLNKLHKEIDKTKDKPQFGYKSSVK